MSVPAINPLVTIKRVVGNGEAIGAQLFDNLGAAINLTGKTVLCKGVDKSGTVIINSQTATLDVAASGKVSYTPTTAEVALMTAGMHIAIYFIIDESVDKRFPYDGPNLRIVMVAEDP